MAPPCLLSPSPLPNARFSTPPAASCAIFTASAAVYEPLAWLFKGLQYALFGLEAKGFAAVSACCHALVRRPVSLSTTTTHRFSQEQLPAEGRAARARAARLQRVQK